MARKRLEEIARNLQEDELQMLLAIAERLLVAQEEKKERCVDLAA